MKRVSEKILITGLSIVVVAIVTIIFISYKLSQKVHATDVLITHTTDVQFHIQKLLSSAIDNETAAREYVLTGSAIFLQPVQKSEVEISANSIELDTHSSFHPSQQPRIDSLKVLLQKRMVHSSTMIGLRREKGLDAAIKFAETGEGKLNTDQIRQLSANILYEENILMQGQRLSNSAAISNLNKILIGLALSIFTLLILVYILVQKSMKAQRKSEQLLLNANSALVKEIKAKNEQLAHIFERITDAFAALDTYYNFTYINKKGGELLQQIPENLIGKNIWTFFPIYDINNQLFYNALDTAMQNQKDVYLVNYYIPFQQWIEVRIYPFPDGASIFFCDITEKKKAEEKILKANRLYNFISAVNQMIVHTVDANTLFKNVCNIAIAQGQFKMAWIGLVDEVSQNVIPVQFAGDEAGYLSEMRKIKIHNVVGGQGPTGTAIREAKYIISNDIEHDVHMQPWKEAALERGYRSSIAVPILKFGKVMGSFNVYAAEKDFFDAEEISLLQEAAGDISFALEIIDKELQRQQAELLITEEKEYSDAIINSLPGIFYLIDEKAKLLRWNKNFETVSGYGAPELSSIHALDFFDINEKELVAAAIQTAFETGSAEIEANFYSKDHKKIPYYFNGFSFKFNNQKCIVGVGTDIYERKTAEEVIKQINKELYELSKHLQTIREEERLQIARDLHDELSQQLTGIKLGMEWLSLKITNEDIKLKDKVNEMVDQIKVTILSVRRITSNLRPTMLDDLGLVAALEWQSIEMKNRHNINIKFRADILEPNPSLEISTALFRIYQEALTNVVRHAAASEVISSLQLVNNKIILEISDNGIGIGNNGKKDNNRFGLIGIKERTFAIGGKFELLSQSGKGTTVKIEVPV
ncbi:MAG: CHASE3 domain-containing protein [Ferruginibacter sp.]